MEIFKTTPATKFSGNDTWQEGQEKIREILNKMESLSLTDQKKFAQIFSQKSKNY